MATDRLINYDQGTSMIEALGTIANNIESVGSVSLETLGMGYTTCSTATATAAKTATLTGYDLKDGGLISVKFTNAVNSGATLNINSKGAKSIYYKGSALTNGIITAGCIATFLYSNNQYNLVNIDNLAGRVTANETNILTVANQTTMYNGLNFANVTNVSNATIDTSAGSVTETNMDSKNIFTFVIYRRNGSTNIDGIYYDGTITGNGVYKIVFEKIATCDNIAFGHSGSTYDLKVTVPVTNLTNGVEYYLVINITNYTHSNNNPFSFDKCMIVPKSVWDSGFTTYQPYVMSNAEITAWILAQS